MTKISTYSFPLKILYLILCINPMLRSSEQINSSFEPSTNIAAYFRIKKRKKKIKKKIGYILLLSLVGTTIGIVSAATYYFFWYKSSTNRDHLGRNNTLPLKENKKHINILLLGNMHNREDINQITNLLRTKVDSTEEEKFNLRFRSMIGEPNMNQIIHDDIIIWFYDTYKIWNWKDTKWDTLWQKFILENTKQANKAQALIFCDIHYVAKISLLEDSDPDSITTTIKHLQNLSTKITIDGQSYSNPFISVETSKATIVLNNDTREFVQNNYHYYNNINDLQTKINEVIKKLQDNPYPKETFIDSD